MLRARQFGWAAACWLLMSQAAIAQSEGVNTLDGIFARMNSCWRPPDISRSRPGFQITVMFAFTRDGAILGQPKVTFESPGASDDDRIAYRTAAMEMLQRCTPMPFTGGLGGAVAGRPLHMRFNDRRNPPPSSERRA